MQSTIDALDTSQRLDMRPAPYKVRRVSGISEMGVAAAIRAHYEKSLVEGPCKIEVGSLTFTATPEVFAILRAVLLAGCCRIEQRSTACREVFVRACGAGIYLDRDALYSTFVSSDTNPFTVIIQNAIREVLGDPGG